MSSRGDLGPLQGDHQGFHRDAQIPRDRADTLRGAMPAPQEDVANVGAAVLGSRCDHAEGGQLAFRADKFAENALSAG